MQHTYLKPTANNPNETKKTLSQIQLFELICLFRASCTYNEGNGNIQSQMQRFQRPLRNAGNKQSSICRGPLPMSLNQEVPRYSLGNSAGNHLEERKAACTGKLHSIFFFSYSCQDLSKGLFQVFLQFHLLSYTQKMITKTCCKLGTKTDNEISTNI